MKPLKIVGIILASFLVIVGLSIGGYKVMQKVEHDEMARIVKSEEVKKIIEDDLKEMDKFALTDKGKIKSYQIDEKSIKHNPMGGIMFNIIINDSISMVGKTGLQMDGENGKIRTDGMTESAGLQALLSE